MQNVQSGTLHYRDSLLFSTNLFEDKRTSVLQQSLLLISFMLIFELLLRDKCH